MEIISAKKIVVLLLCNFVFYECFPVLGDTIDIENDVVLPRNNTKRCSPRKSQGSLLGSRHKPLKSDESDEEDVKLEPLVSRISEHLEENPRSASENLREENSREKLFEVDEMTKHQVSAPKLSLSERVKNRFKALEAQFKNRVSEKSAGGLPSRSKQDTEGSDKQHFELPHPDEKIHFDGHDINSFLERSRAALEQKMVDIETRLAAIDSIEEATHAVQHESPSISSRMVEVDETAQENQVSDQTLSARIPQMESRFTIFPTTPQPQEDFHSADIEEKVGKEVETNDEELLKRIEQLEDTISDAGPIVSSPLNVKGIDDIAPTTDILSEFSNTVKTHNQEMREQISEHLDELDKLENDDIVAARSPIEEDAVVFEQPGAENPVQVAPVAKAAETTVSNKVIVYKDLDKELETSEEILSRINSLRKTIDEMEENFDSEIMEQNKDDGILKSRPKDAEIVEAKESDGLEEFYKCARDYLGYAIDNAKLELKTTKDITEDTVACPLAETSPKSSIRSRFAETPNYSLFLPQDISKGHSELSELLSRFKSNADRMQKDLQARLSTSTVQPSPPYNSEEVERFLEENRKVLNEKLQQIEKKVQKFQEKRARYERESKHSLEQWKVQEHLKESKKALDEKIKDIREKIDDTRSDLKGKLHENAEKNRQKAKSLVPRIRKRMKGYGTRRRNSQMMRKLIHLLLADSKKKAASSLSPRSGRLDSSASIPPIEMSPQYPLELPSFSNSFTSTPDIAPGIQTPLRARINAEVRSGRMADPYNSINDEEMSKLYRNVFDYTGSHGRVLKEALLIVDKATIPLLVVGRKDGNFELLLDRKRIINSMRESVASAQDEPWYTSANNRFMDLIKKYMESDKSKKKSKTSRSSTTGDDRMDELSESVSMFIRDLLSDIRKSHTKK